MDFDEYQRRSLRSLNLRAEEGMTVKKTMAILGAMGMAGEVGECTEPVKKWFFHHSRTDQQVRAELLEELGDVLWYAACLAESFDIKLGEVAERNIAKLLARYPERAANATGE